MTNRIVLKACLVGENGDNISEEVISDKKIIPPTDCSNFGYNQQEQLKILEKAQQKLLDEQADFLKSET